KDKETGEMTPRAKHIIGQTPMGRYGTPEELVGAIVFLASDAASFVTGTVLCIDGGFGNFAI
ncbi:SDR family oxidoreductase, partial [Luoshenia tenuis]